MLKFLSRVNVNNGIQSKNNGARVLYLLTPCRHRAALIRQKNFALLLQMLKLQQDEVSNIVAKCPRLMTLPPEQIYVCNATCLKYGIQEQDIIENPEILKIRPISVEHRVLLMREAGFSIVDARMVIGYINLTKKSVDLLKRHNVLPADADVTKNFLSHLHHPPPEIPPLPSKGDTSNMYEIQMACLHYYLSWKLEMTSSQLENMFKIYTRVKYKSFTLLKQSMDLLINDIGLSKEKIRNNGYLLHTQPKNTRRMLDEVKDIGGWDTRTVLRKWPKIIITNIETMHRTTQHLKDFNISDEAIRKCPEIYTLASDTVLKRLHDLKTIPSFSVLCNHPRVLRLVHYQTKAKNRLEYLQKIRLKCASLHILSAPEELFEKYAREGADKTKGKDIIGYLIQELGKGEEEIRSVIPRHPFWCHVPLVEIKETLDYLITQRYTKDDIFKNSQILLYPRYKVEESLNTLNPEDLKAFSKPITPSQQLALCVYNMERNIHFTGDGVWDKADDNSTDAKSDNNHVKAPENVIVS